jgi:hypothetical protein
MNDGNESYLNRLEGIAGKDLKTDSEQGQNGEVRETFSREEIQVQINKFKDFLSKNGYDFDKLVKAGVLVGELNVDVVEQFYKNNLKNKKRISTFDLSKAFNSWIEMLQQVDIPEEKFLKSNSLSIFLVYKESSDKQDDVTKAIKLICELRGLQKEELTPEVEVEGEDSQDNFIGWVTALKKNEEDLVDSGENPPTIEITEEDLVDSGENPPTIEITEEDLPRGAETAPYSDDLDLNLDRDASNIIGEQKKGENTLNPKKIFRKLTDWLTKGRQEKQQSITFGKEELELPAKEFGFSPYIDQQIKKHLSEEEENLTDNQINEVLTLASEQILDAYRAYDAANDQEKLEGEILKFRQLFYQFLLVISYEGFKFPLPKYMDQDLIVREEEEGQEKEQDQDRDGEELLILEKVIKKYIEENPANDREIGVYRNLLTGIYNKKIWQVNMVLASLLLYDINHHYIDTNGKLLSTEMVEVYSSMIVLLQRRIVELCEAADDDESSVEWNESENGEVDKVKDIRNITKNFADLVIKLMPLGVKL